MLNVLKLYYMKLGCELDILDYVIKLGCKLVISNDAIKLGHEQVIHKLFYAIGT